MRAPLIVAVAAGKLTQEAIDTGEGGGTAGDTRFGVLRARADGTPRRLVLWRKDCCPSSFRLRRYTWTGHRFRVGKAHKLKTVPPRFYKP